MHKGGKLDIPFCGFHNMAFDGHRPGLGNVCTQLKCPRTVAFLHKQAFLATRPATSCQQPF